MKGRRRAERERDCQISCDPMTLTSATCTSFLSLHTTLLTRINMKSFIALLTLPLALATSLKSVVVTFPKGTPDSVISQAKHSLVASVRSVSLQRGS